MGKRNRERVARIRAGQEKARAIPLDPKEKAKQGFCPFPGCSATPMKAPGAHGFCARHESFAADLLFILPRIQCQPVKRQSGLVLPGDRDFTLDTTVKQAK